MEGLVGRFSILPCRLIRNAVPSARGRRSRGNRIRSAGRLSREQCRVATETPGGASTGAFLKAWGDTATLSEEDNRASRGGAASPPRPGGPSRVFLDPGQPPEPLREGQRRRRGLARVGGASARPPSPPILAATADHHRPSGLARPLGIPPLPRKQSGGCPLHRSADSIAPARPEAHAPVVGVGRKAYRLLCRCGRILNGCGLRAPGD